MIGNKMTTKAGYQTQNMAKNCIIQTQNIKTRQNKTKDKTADDKITEDNTTNYKITK